MQQGGVRGRTSLPTPPGDARPGTPPCIRAGPAAPLRRSIMRRDVLLQLGQQAAAFGGVACWLLQHGVQLAQLLLLQVELLLLAVQRIFDFWQSRIKRG